MLKTLFSNGIEATVRLPLCSTFTLRALNPASLYNQHRFKSKKSKSAVSEAYSGTDDDDDDTQFNNYDDVVDKGSKIIQTTVPSLRADVILKSGLGVARNKIDVLFYESKLRLNGKKLLKKSSELQEGDELDVVKGPSTTNPDFLTVARVEILNADSKGDGFKVKLRRCRNLLVPSYDNRTVDER